MEFHKRIMELEEKEVNEMAYKKEGEVKDLAEKLEKGELTPKEIIKILKERGIKERRHWSEVIGLIVWGVLCFLPAAAKFSNLEVLSFLVRLPTIKFPMSAVYLAIILSVFGSCMEVYAGYWRIKKGGLRSEDDTVVLIKTGPYGIVRHPDVGALTVNLIAITVAVSKYVPFTILSVVGNIVLIVTIYYCVLVEERELSLKKWGDEYRQYMKEVPRFNFIKGLWNLRKKR
ncbi:MAG TPA: isoprenylcysteine carboxylmethyltransferase family protein [Thermoplasmata archaeon]|nr:isoprenylcysteine carboxylmethyltransferase family protein [Thermoplasmata archaeon]